MTGHDVALCLGAVCSSSAAQLLMKASAARRASLGGMSLLGVGVGLQCVSVIFAVLVLRHLHLSQLMPFAALAYVLVPLGSALVFGERLTMRFWHGAILIACGIFWMFSANA